MFETWLVEMMTGDKLKRLDPSSFPWSTSIAGDGQGTATFTLPDESQLTDAQIAAARDRRHADFRPNQRGLAVLAGSTVLYLGKIQDWDYSRDGGSVIVSTVELRNELAWRMTYGVNQYENGTLTVTNRSVSGAVRAILARFMQWSADWVYPIDLPADGAGGFTQKWEYWKKYKISDLIAQIEDEGYEVYFRPYQSADGRQIRLQTRVAPKVTIDASTFILNAPQSPLDGVSYKLSGVDEVTGLQGLGEGTGEVQAVKWAGSPVAQGRPVRDVKQEFPDIADARLQAATDAELAARSDPLVQFKVRRFHASEEWSPAHATPGRVWNLYAHRDRMIPDGWHKLRVIRASGNITTRAIDTEVQYGPA